MGLEKQLETKFRNAVKRQGGLALKFVSPSFSGVPDRIVLMPGGIVRFAELKAPGKKPTPLQVSVHDMFAKLGSPVAVIDSDETIQSFFDDL